MSLRVLFFTPYIQPGGGPAGYVYHLQQAILHTPTRHRFAVMANAILDSRLPTRTMRGFLTRKLVKIKWMLNKRLYRAFYLHEIDALLRQRPPADVLVVHGCIGEGAVHRLNRLRSSYRWMIYMPHTPCINADEYFMLAMQRCRLDAKPPSRRLHEKLVWAERLLLASVDAVVFPSEHAGAAYRQAFPDVLHWQRQYYLKSGITPPSVPGGSVASALPDKQGRIAVGFVGRYVPHKGYGLFLDACARIAPHALFVSCGQGGIAARSPVIDLGWRTDIGSVLEWLDIVVVPNLIAYYDLLPLEAAAFGKPIVFTPVGGNIDQAQDLPDTLSASAAAAEALAIAIREAIARKLAQPSWGERNREAFQREFTASAMLQRWDRAITDLFEQPASDAR